MSQKRVLWFGHDSTMNGAERCMLESASDLVKAGYEVQAVLPRQGPLVAALKEAGIRDVHLLRLPWWIDRGYRMPLGFKIMQAAKIVYSAGRLIPFFKKIRPDIVVSNTIAVPVAAMAARLTGTKHVWYIHEFGREDHSFHFLFGEKRSCRRIGRLSNKVIVNSTSVKNKFEKYIPAEKMNLIYYEVRVPSSLTALSAQKQASQPMKILAAGRITPSKGQVDAVMAVSYLVHRKGIKNFRLCILGADEMTGYLKLVIDTIEKENVKDYVDIKPFAFDPFALMQSYDLMLVCSRNEAFGRITVEAMKLGLPVIATNKGGSLDIVKENFNGLLYTPGQYEELGEQIAKILASPSFYEGLSRNAAAFANETFSAEQHTRSLTDVLESL